MTCNKNYTYDCDNSVLWFDSIGNLLINHVPYLLQSRNNFVVQKIPRVPLLSDPPKESGDEVFMPTVLLVNAVVVSYAHSSGVRGPSEGSGVLTVSFWSFVSS
jgi:hypothetical protein